MLLTMAEPKNFEPNLRRYRLTRWDRSSIGRADRISSASETRAFDDPSPNSLGCERDARKNRLQAVAPLGDGR